MRCPVHHETPAIKTGIVRNSVQSSITAYRDQMLERAQKAAVLQS